MQSTQMETTIKELIQILIKENQWIDKLVEIGEEKKQVIILNQVQELDKLVQKEGALVAALERLEANRFKTQQNLAQTLEMPAEELTASVLLEKAAAYFPQWQAELNDEVERMQQAIFKLRGINAENHELIGLSLDYIDSIQALFNDEGTGTYSENGKQQDDNQNRSLNRVIDKKV
ncbi:FlgN-like domain [Syntrophomonas zehnderi OL-4]|uniref:FlgN-like domain n=1 Tax=Syntrophomonas zehnderi OL-4 TaxID=690567 RepID=A0A0E4GAH3_9FIRM|nr:flagellar protein FlgN [Syntrophomonas zehnderi]CFX12354.1 FlgN-like domain [Syntrophomonas zehnderi OL-4]